MFRIRKVHDDSTPANRASIEQAQEILRAQFPGLSEEDVEKVPLALRNPLRYRFKAVLLVAEDARDRMRGFALLQHAPDLEFSYLEYISAAPGVTGGGIGGALYERVRQEAAALDPIGLFFECLPDDPALSPDPTVRKQNAARLRFYERYGARPIANTAYETPVKPGDTDPPYLVLDPLDRDRLPSRDELRSIVRAILKRKYAKLCPPRYVRTILDSVQDDPVKLREPRYSRRKTAGSPPPAVLNPRRIALVVNDRHSIHHIRERGYVESPVRIKSLLEKLEPTGLFQRMKAQHFPVRTLESIHDRDFVSYLQQACESTPMGTSIYPYVFPVRNASRPPKELPRRAGYFCIDTFTPIHRNAFPAALGAVNCALTGAQAILDGHHLAYALVRPPGHHAERRAFGGFCYFNSAAAAAHLLSRFGRVAVLDIDYHHGNGTQDIFYRRADVLTVSIHGHPRTSYPYFSGFDDEKGEGEGLGFNLNLPLPEGLDGERYRTHLDRALRTVARFGPTFLVLALGLDTARGDPTGSFTLGAEDFRSNGERIGALGYPTLVVQEGGYLTRSLGTNARAFFDGLSKGAQRGASGHRLPPALRGRGRKTPGRLPPATT